MSFDPNILRSCRGCGCDDNHACIAAAGPCRWALLDLDGPTGICSACAIALGWRPELLARVGFDDDDEIEEVRATLTADRLAQTMGGLRP